MTKPLGPLHSDREKQRVPIPCWHHDPETGSRSPSTLVAVQLPSGDWIFHPLHERFTIHCDQTQLIAFCKKVLQSHGH